MRRVGGWIVFLAPIAVVIGLGELHAHLVGHYSFTGTNRFGWTLAYIALLEISAYASGLPDSPRSAVGALWTGAGAAVGAALVISIVQLLSASAVLPREVVLGSALLLAPTFALAGIIDQRARMRNAGADPVLAVVGPTEGAALEADLTREPERPAVLLGTVDPGAGGGSDRPVLAAADGSDPRVVVLSRSAQADEAVVAQAALLHSRGTKVRTLSLFYDEWLGKLPVADLEPVSLMFDIQELHAPRYARLKRVVDLVTGLLGLALVVVVLPLVWILDRAGNPGPLFFRQERVGKAGRPFTMLKFRTMAPAEAVHEAAAAGAWTAPDDPRLGSVGRWLRRSHLDELPQALNLLRGDLSLVGPRPEQPRYVAELREKIPFYDVRHLVKPGLTGWAQVKFPYGASVEDALEKLQYEFYYLRHQGPLLDARILARTVRTVLRLRGR